MIEARITIAGYRNGFTVRNIGFKVDDGEALVVTGPSGSGKTTLIRALTGVLDKVGGFIDGSIIINGEDVSKLPSHKLYELLTYIPQEPWYGIIGYTVYSEHCYSLSLIGAPCTLSSLEALGLLGKRDSLTINLSAGETQRLLWAEALAKKARILLLDEPLVYLDQDARGFVRDFIVESMHRGSSVILVDHDPWYWRSLQGKLLVLDNGVVKYYGEWRDEVLPHNVSPVRVNHAGKQGEVVVEARNVWFKYPGDKPLFKGIDLTIEKGSFTGLIGGNGAGKTTLLKLIAGILKPSRGWIKRFGRAVYLPENPLLYFTKPTPRDELLYMAGYDESKALDVAELFGLTRILDTPLARLSSGERRRLAIASSYLGGFDIYLVDEPTGGLDQANAVKVLEALLHLVNEGRTVITATHDERVVRVLDKVVKVGAGQWGL